MILMLMLLHFLCMKVSSEPTVESEKQHPSVVIATLIRNKAHTLPWFLGLIEKLDYPKDRIALWIASDHNVDNSTAILKEWLAAMKSSYHDVEVKIDPKKRGYSDEDSPMDWTEKRFSNVIKLREKALNYAREKWADYLFMVDADATLENDKTLQHLIDQKKFIIAPMLNSSTEGYYSNFWGAMSPKGYYQRSGNYGNIVDRELVGVFKVPMVHTVLLIDLNHALAPNISYQHAPPGYKGPRDDIIIFCHTVKALGTTMHVSNLEYFGKVMIPLDKGYSMEDDYDQFAHVKLEAMVEEVPPLYHSRHVFVPEIPKDKMDFDEIYMINLKRRPERRFRMMTAFDYLGIDAKIVDAVDGHELNDTYIQELGIEMLPGYEDPYHKRSLTMGEIGCFLSHYNIWKEVVAKGYGEVVVFEDDVRFEPFFRKKLALMMQEVAVSFPEWDLIYLGRKRLRKDLERMVEGSDRLAWPHYSYWTISYLLSNSGAKKLLAQKPLSKMVPVDEYLPIMFDRHPEESWRLQFSPRNLLGLSSEPFLVYPTHYVGDESYFSDTEESLIIDDESGTNSGTDEETRSEKTARPENDENLDDGAKKDEL